MSGSEAEPLELYLSDVSPKDKPWDSHRVNASQVQALYEQSDRQGHASRIHQCSNFLGFTFQAGDEGDIQLKLQEARFCRCRHCPVCQWRRSLMWRARFFQALPRVIEAYPTARWIFLTLTVKNCPLGELRSTLNEMQRAWKRLSQLKSFPAIGWVKSVEVTRGADDSAHPHFHCLLMVPSSYFARDYITQAEWTELWKQALRIDYTPVVNVKAVKLKGKTIQSPSDENSPASEALIRAILETLKYAVKPDDLVGKGNDDPGTIQRNAQWLSDLTSQLAKTRAVAVGGVLREFINQEEPEDLIHGDVDPPSLTEDDPLIWFGWKEMIRRYVKR